MTLRATMYKFWQSLDAASDDPRGESGMSLVEMRRAESTVQVLDYEERFDRLLAHYGLEHLIDTNANLGWLRVVPLLEKMKDEIEELRAKDIWGDSNGTE